VLVRMYADPGTASLLPALVAAMARSPHVAEAVRTGMVAEWRAAMRAVFARAAARGELRADADVDLALELLSAPPFYRFLMLGERVDDRYVKALVAAALATVAVAPPATRRPHRSTTG
jgi:predicted nucleotidyltransferase